MREKKAPLAEQIKVLEDYKEKEFTEKWSYELAKLYYQDGDKEKCLELCNEIILWFNEGSYVMKAMDLKQRMGALKGEEKERYEQQFVPKLLKPEDVNSIKVEAEEKSAEPQTKSGEQEIESIQIKSEELDEVADGLVWHRRTIFLQIICHAVVCIGRVTHLNTDEKTVQLGLREHLGSGRANRVLSGNDHEGIQHLAGDAVYGYRALFHDFQKGGLGLGGGTVDLIGKEQVAHNCTGLVYEGILFFYVHGNTCDVGGENVRGELDTVLGQVHGTGKGKSHGGFAYAPYR